MAVVPPGYGNVLYLTYKHRLLRSRYTGIAALHASNAKDELGGSAHRLVAAVFHSFQMTVIALRHRRGAFSKRKILTRECGGMMLAPGPFATNSQP